MRTFENNYPQITMNICVQKWILFLFYTIISLIYKRKTLGELVGDSKGLVDAISDNVAYFLPSVNQFVSAAMVWKNLKNFMKTIPGAVDPYILDRGQNGEVTHLSSKYLRMTNRKEFRRGRPSQKMLQGTA